jgi:transcriptional regulator with XRE-family HTH domain
METPNIVSFTSRMNLTYKELAEKISKSTGFVGQLASGDSSVSYNTMLDLVRLGMNADELFGEELAKMFRKRCYEEFLEQNGVNNGITSNKSVAEGIRTVIGGLNLILKEYETSENKG